MRNEDLITTKKLFVCKNRGMETEPRRRGRKPKAPQDKATKLSISLDPALIAALHREVDAERARSISDAASKLISRALQLDIE